MGVSGSRVSGSKASMVEGYRLRVEGLTVWGCRFKGLRARGLGFKVVFEALSSRAPGGFCCRTVSLRAQEVLENFAVRVQGLPNRYDPYLQMRAPKL